MCHGRVCRLNRLRRHPHSRRRTSLVVSPNCSPQIQHGLTSRRILSYILHGHVAEYQDARPHFDPIIHRALTALPSTTTQAGQTTHSISTIPPESYNHLNSSIRYSSQALPINTLLDTLVRPNADTDPDPISCIDWVKDQSRVISHLVITDEATAGGQWASSAFHPAGDSAEKARSSDIGTLSYAEQLNLPGYSYGDFFQDTHGEPMGTFERPTKREIAEYLACYPVAAGIDGALMTHSRVVHVERCEYRSSNFAHSGGSWSERGTAGFLAIVRTSSLDQLPSVRQIICRHLVLASGTFTHPLLPLPPLAPLLDLSSNSSLSSGVVSAPVLVIGSGFSAADAILASPVDQPTLHIFKWDPEERPSPLKGCHYQAYPEYAGVYRRMKMAALKSSGSSKYAKVTSPLATRKRERNPFEKMRNWDDLYEGLPNAEIIEVKAVSPCQDNDWTWAQHRNMSDSHQGARQVVIKIRLQSGDIVERRVSGLRYVVGRRGTLDYLSNDLRSEVLQDNRTRNGSAPVDQIKPHSTNLKDRFRTNTNSFPQEYPANIKNEISGNTFRSRLISPDDGSCNLEVAPEVFVIGSLTGDSLIRHALGGCLWTACEILQRQDDNYQNGIGSFANGRTRAQTPTHHHREVNKVIGSQTDKWSRTDRDLGIADAYVASISGCLSSGEENCDTSIGALEEADMCWKTRVMTNGSRPVSQHADLHIDRKEVFRRSREFLDDG